MHNIRNWIVISVFMSTTILSGCTNQSVKHDYRDYKESRPASILVLPPLNNSTEVGATYSFLSHVTLPLSESGYYIFPVAVVDETFRQNGLTNPTDIHAIPLKRLVDIFGADAALYIEVTNYGTRYIIISSETRVTAKARLVDLRTGKKLWSGEATASSAEGRGGSGGGLVGLLVEAVVAQVIEDVTDAGHQISAVASTRLLTAGKPNGLLYGPRSPKYQTD